MAQYTEQDIEREAEDKPQDKEFMATLAKGFAVLGLFDKQRPAMTLSEAAAVHRISRARPRGASCARSRSLATWCRTGGFSLSSGILKLGFAYLATQNWIDRLRHSCGS